MMNSIVNISQAAQGLDCVERWWEVSETLNVKIALKSAILERNNTMFLQGAVFQSANLSHVFEILDVSSWARVRNFPQLLIWDGERPVQFSFDLGGRINPFFRLERGGAFFLEYLRWPLIRYHLLLWHFLTTLICLFFFLTFLICFQSTFFKTWGRWEIFVLYEFFCLTRPAPFSLFEAILCVHSWGKGLSSKSDFINSTARYSFDHQRTRDCKMAQNKLHILTFWLPIIPQTGRWRDRGITGLGLRLQPLRLGLETSGLKSTVKPNISTLDQNTILRLWIKKKYRNFGIS